MPSLVKVIVQLALKLCSTTAFVTWNVCKFIQIRARMRYQCYPQQWLIVAVINTTFLFYHCCKRKKNSDIKGWFFRFYFYANTMILLLLLLDFSMFISHKHQLLFLIMTSQIESPSNTCRRNNVGFALDWDYDIGFLERDRNYAINAVLCAFIWMLVFLWFFFFFQKVFSNRKKISVLSTEVVIGRMLVVGIW